MKLKFINDMLVLKTIEIICKKIVLYLNHLFYMLGYYYLSWDWTMVVYFIITFISIHGCVNSRQDGFLTISGLGGLIGVFLQPNFLF